MGRRNLLTSIDKRLKVGGRRRRRLKNMRHALHSTKETKKQKITKELVPRDRRKGKTDERDLRGHHINTQTQTHFYDTQRQEKKHYGTKLLYDEPRTNG